MHSHKLMVHIYKLFTLCGFHKRLISEQHQRGHTLQTLTYTYMWLHNTIIRLYICLLIIIYHNILWLNTYITMYIPSEYNNQQFITLCLTTSIMDIQFEEMLCVILPTICNLNEQLLFPAFLASCHITKLFAGISNTLAPYSYLLFTETCLKSLQLYRSNQLGFSSDKYMYMWLYWGHGFTTLASQHLCRTAS